MTAGTSPSRRVARAAPLPARSRATASIRTVWTIGRTPLAWVMSRLTEPNAPETGAPASRGAGAAAGNSGSGPGGQRKAKAAGGEPPAGAGVAALDAPSHAPAVRG